MRTLARLKLVLDPDDLQIGEPDADARGPLPVSLPVSVRAVIKATRRAPGRRPAAALADEAASFLDRKKGQSRICITTMTHLASASRPHRVICR